MAPRLDTFAEGTGQNVDSHLRKVTQRRRRKEERNSENLQSRSILDSKPGNNENSQLQFELRILQSLIPGLRTLGNEIGEVRRLSQCLLMRRRFLTFHISVQISLPFAKMRARHVQLDQ